MAVETLSLPFGSWREGLLALADALQDPARERIVVERLKTTSTAIQVGPREIYSLALLAPSLARQEEFERPEPPPEIVRLVEKANADGELDRIVSGMRLLAA